MMETQIYDAQADTINVDDIVTDDWNRIFMRSIKDDNIESMWIVQDYGLVEIQNGQDYNVRKKCNYYVPEGSHDMGWLGYFVGKNHCLEYLLLGNFIPKSGESVEGVLRTFFRGMKKNKSIQHISFSSMDILGGEIFTMFGLFFKNNHNLTAISIMNCNNFGDNGARLFALALGSCTNKSLRKLVFSNNNIAEEGMVDIITALSMHPNMAHLDLEANHLGYNSCMALATLLRCSATEMQNLYISNTDVDDDRIEALVPALSTCKCLQLLKISSNPSITTRGWQSFATILETPNCNLERLDTDGWNEIASNNIDDKVLAAFANALKNNHTLQSLHLYNSPSITTIGWQPIIKLLSNTLSVNATFLSNHTLWDVGQLELGYSEHETLESLLELNRRTDKKEVATVKVLQQHGDFEMQPFFEWEFKVLPMVLDWLETASACQMPQGFEPHIERRKLSCIYQFVRGMPLLYVETFMLNQMLAPPPNIPKNQLKMWRSIIQRRKNQLQTLSNTQLQSFANDVITDLVSSRYELNEYTNNLNNVNNENSQQDSTFKMDLLTGHHSSLLLMQVPPQLPNSTSLCHDLTLHLVALFYRSVDERLPPAIRIHGLNAVRRAFASLDHWLSVRNKESNGEKKNDGGKSNEC